MIKLVVFDADGVTINGEPFSKELARKYNIPSESTLKFFKGIFKDTKTNQADLKEVIAPFLKKWGWVKTIDEFFRKITEDWPKIQKEEMLFWDDKEENILAAREFGWNAEVYKDFADFQNKITHYLSISPN